VAQLRDENRKLFDEICRTLLGLSTQDELAAISEELADSDASLDAIAKELKDSDTSLLQDLSPFLGVLLGAGLAYGSTAWLQSKQRRDTRSSLLRELIATATAATNRWAIAAQEGSTSTTAQVAVLKRDALDAGQALLASLRLALDQPDIVGTSNTEVIQELHLTAERIFGKDGLISDNEPESAAEELTTLTSAANRI
jgi:hypothetical protein